MLKKLFSLHLLPFLISAAIAVSVAYWPVTGRYFLRFDTAVPAAYLYPDTSTWYYPNYINSYNTEITLRNALHNGNSIVVIGSSEMTTSAIPAMPYNFFNKHHIACLGFGHEGNQDMSVLAQLMAMHTDLDRAKLVFILSPGWFEGKSANGTSSQSFLEFLNERFLYLLYFDVSIPQSVKDYVFDYVARIYKDIDSPSAIIRLIYYTHLAQQSVIHKIAMTTFCRVYENICLYKMHCMTELFHENLSLQPFATEHYPEHEFSSNLRQRFNWDSLQLAAKAKFATESTNNTWGIENSYFTQWMNGKSKRIIDLVSPVKNIEFKDFCKLLEFLKACKCKPLFIMQPLNPLTYKNMKDIDPVLSAIGDELQKQGFTYINFHTSDDGKYEKGMLKDFQHFGEMGWYKVDEAIFNYFSK